MSITLPWRSVWVIDRSTKGENGRFGRYRVCWIDDDGHRRSLSYPAKRAAEIARDLKQRELNSWCQMPGVKPWPDLVEEYGLSLATASQTHQEMTARVLGRFAAICHPTVSSRISETMCDQFMADRAAGKPLGKDGQPCEVSDETLRRDHRMMSAFFAWCVHRRYMDRNPMQSVRAPSKVHRRKRGVRSRDWVSLLRALNNRDLATHDPQAWHLMILLGVVTGLRQSVLLHCYFGVSVDDREALKVLEARHRRDGGFCVVQLADASDGIGVLHTFSGKTLKESLVGLPKVVTDRVAVRIGDLPAGSARLFPWQRWQRKAWERINATAKVDFTFQSLRGASGTREAIARAERAAADHLEHSSVRVTRDHYLDHEQLAKAVAIGEGLPRLPKMPAYKRLPVTQSMPGRRPIGNAPSSPPEQTVVPPDGVASRRAC